MVPKGQQPPLVAQKHCSTTTLCHHVPLEPLLPCTHNDGSSDAIKRFTLTTPPNHALLLHQQPFCVGVTTIVLLVFLVCVQLAGIAKAPALFVVLVLLSLALSCRIVLITLPSRAHSPHPPLLQIRSTLSIF